MRSAHRTTSSPGDLAEDLVRTDGIEDGEAGIEGDGDLHGVLLGWFVGWELI